MKTLKSSLHFVIVLKTLHKDNSPEEDLSILIKTLVLFRTNYYSKENFFTWCHHKQSLLILFTMQSYKSYYMVSPQTVFTYPFHHAKLQILHMVSPQTVFTYPFHHAKLQILLIISSGLILSWQHYEYFCHFNFVLHSNPIQSDWGQIYIFYIHV